MLQVGPAEYIQLQQDRQPGKQSPRILCNLTFPAGLGPLSLGLSLEKAQDAHGGGLQHHPNKGLG